MSSDNSIKQIKDWRQHLHIYPENAFEKTQTADFIARVLTGLGLEAHRNIGTFLRHITGCFVFLGSGKSAKATENTSLHNSRYEYNDDVLETGAKFFAEHIKVRLPR